MEKFITLTLAALIFTTAVVDAATTITTVTTTVIDEAKGDQCRQKFQPQQQLEHCMMYISPRGSQSPRLMNPQEQHLEECCQQFQKVDRDCRCSVLKEMVRQQQQMGQMEMEERQQMVRDAMNLPTRCNVDMPKQCQIQAIYF